jgi:hypothetical protein
VVLGACWGVAEIGCIWTRPALANGRTIHRLLFSLPCRSGRRVPWMPRPCCPESVTFRSMRDGSLRRMTPQAARGFVSNRSKKLIFRGGRLPLGLRVCTNRKQKASVKRRFHNDGRNRVALAACLDLASGQNKRPQRGAEAEVTGTKPGSMIRRSRRFQEWPNWKAGWPNSFESRWQLFRTGPVTCFRGIRTWQQYGRN